MRKLVCVLLPIALVASGALVAGDQKSEPASGQAEMRAGFDRETGRFRALTAQEQRELNAQGNGRSRALELMRRGGVAQPETEAQADAQEVMLQDGSVLRPVPIEHMVSLEARLDADGNLVIEHNDPGLDGGHAHDHTHSHTPAREDRPHE